LRFSFLWCWSNIHSIQHYCHNIKSYRYTEMWRTSDSLLKAIQNVIDELDSEYQFNVRSTVDSWSMQRCFPVLKVMRNYFRDVVTISVQFHNKLDEEQYHIPVTYTTESKPNFTITWSNIRWLTSSNSQIELLLERDRWIILNLQQAGKNWTINLYFYYLFILCVISTLWLNESKLI